ncbi:MAG: MFS transporter [Chloroflexi bacterium]|nr:MFS transporter [Chloroflexota bacterium]
MFRVLFARLLPGVLRHRDFRLLWLAQSISTFGDALTTLTLVLLINRLTGSTAAIATLTILIAVPGVVLGMFAGVFVDRYDRRRIMLVSDLTRAAFILGFVLVHTREHLWLLYGLALVQASVGAFFMPAREALVQVVVPEAERLPAHALTDTSFTLAELAGTALAGVLVGVTGTFFLSFVIDAATFCASFALVRLVRAHALPLPSSHSNPWHELLKGWKVIGSSRLLIAILLTGGLMFLGGAALQVLLIPFSLNVLHVPVVWSGILGAGSVVGTVLGGAALTRWGARLSPTHLMIGGLFAFAVTIALMGLAPNAWVLALINLGFGVILVVLQSSFATLIQNTVSNDLMGRVGSIFTVVMLTANIFSLLIAGVLGTVMGIRQVFFLLAALMAFSGLVATLMMGTQTGTKNKQA